MNRMVHDSALESCLDFEILNAHDNVHGGDPQISTRVDFLGIKTNQTNWTLLKHGFKEPIFLTTDIYVKRFLKGHEPIFWFVLPTDKLLVYFHEKQSTLVDICGVFTSICGLLLPIVGWRRIHKEKRKKRGRNWQKKHANKWRKYPAVVAWFAKASVFHSVNSAPCANGGSNPVEVWCINRSEIEISCIYSYSRAPGPISDLWCTPLMLAVKRLS